MNRELCLVICFFVGIVAFYLLKTSYGCKIVEGGNSDMSCTISTTNYLGSRNRDAVITSCETINDPSKIDTTNMSAEELCITGGADPTGQRGDCSWGVPSDSAGNNSCRWANNGACNDWESTQWNRNMYSGRCDTDTDLTDCMAPPPTGCCNYTE